MKKVYIILFYLIHLHGASNFLPENDLRDPFFGVEGCLDSFSEFELVARQGQNQVDDFLNTTYRLSRQDSSGFEVLNVPNFCRFEDSNISLGSESVEGKASLDEKCDSILPCDRCNFVFSTKSSLQKHKCQKVKKSKPRKISEDSDQEKDGSHLVKRSKEIHSTGIDQKKTFSHLNIKLMGLLFYSTASEISTKCQFCDFISTITDKKWRDHICLHVNLLKKTKNKVTDKFKCCYDDFCPTESKYPCDLVDHVIMHMGLKLFTCNECSMVFSSNSSLSVHTKQHIEINK